MQKDAFLHETSLLYRSIYGALGLIEITAALIDLRKLQISRRFHTRQVRPFRHINCLAEIFFGAIQIVGSHRKQPSLIQEFALRAKYIVFPRILKSTLN